MNGKQFLELLSRLPARVWIQAILGLIGFVVLAVLGFAVIAGVAAVALVLLLAYKAKAWFMSFFRRDLEPAPPARHHDGKITDVQFEIVDRTNDRTPRP
ncbi:MAG: hypothetical protein EPO41_08320 [Reyranella sp.]|uniref:hypothetical protein n=1 Tax=Reyranella sp. TaxID=1929291 RepID=UPI001223D676|nr:hypothetical protein [Reyranella sp.]TAJ95806.1 MAG: hypothetical protein EPO41_08320 [Reyranella sp.]